MLLLAFDTATPAITVALHETDAGADHAGAAPPASGPGSGGDRAAERSTGRTLAAARHQDARRHGELLLGSIDQVLREAGCTLGDVAALVVGVGPGPYTGLRVGLATAESFSAALGTPVYGLCTLDGIAYASGLTAPFVVATDARRKEVYWAQYADRRTRLGSPAVDRPEEIAPEVAQLPAVGAGAVLYDGVFQGVRTDLPAEQSASALAHLAAEKLAAGGEFLPGRPLYLRRPDAQVPAGYKVVTPK